MGILLIMPIPVPRASATSPCGRLSPREPIPDEISAAEQGVRDRQKSRRKSRKKFLGVEGVLREETAKPQDKL